MSAIDERIVADSLVDKTRLRIPKCAGFGCVTGNSEVTPKMEFCPDWRPSVRNADSVRDRYLQ